MESLKERSLYITQNPAPVSRGISHRVGAAQQQQSRLTSHVHGVTNASCSFDGITSLAIAHQNAHLLKTDLRLAVTYAQNKTEAPNVQPTSLLLTPREQLRELGSANRHRQQWLFPAKRALPSEFKTPSPPAQAARIRLPREVRKDDLAFALRLIQEIPILTVENSLMFSGLQTVTARDRSAFKTLCAAAEDARGKHPHQSGAGNADHAMRLNARARNRSVIDPTTLSAIGESTLRNPPASKIFPAATGQARSSHAQSSASLPLAKSAAQCQPINRPPTHNFPYWIVNENEDREIQSVFSPEGIEYPLDVIDNSDNFYVIRDATVIHVVNHVGGPALSFADDNEMQLIIHEEEFRRASAAIRIRQ